MAAFHVQLAALRLAAERELVETRKRNISYVGATHRGLAPEVWPKYETQFTARVARHYSGELGNINGIRKEKPNLLDLKKLI
jgi:hypothetical protein